MYALLYQSHKSWYSWAVNSHVGAMYAFDFLAMTPKVKHYGAGLLRPASTSCCEACTLSFLTCQNMAIV